MLGFKIFQFIPLINFSCENSFNYISDQSLLNPCVYSTIFPDLTFSDQNVLENIFDIFWKFTNINSLTSSKRYPKIKWEFLFSFLLNSLSISHNINYWDNPPSFHISFDFLEFEFFLKKLNFPFSLLSNQIKSFSFLLSYAGFDKIIQLLMDCPPSLFGLPLDFIWETNELWIAPIDDSSDIFEIQIEKPTNFIHYIVCNFASQIRLSIRKKYFKIIFNLSEIPDLILFLETLDCQITS